MKSVGILIPASLVLAASLVAADAAMAQTALVDSGQPAYQDSSRPPVERAADLVSRMTLGEKAAQLINDAPAIPRLGVREYNWWNEGLHGVVGAGYTTVFPQAIGLAATFDDDHVRRVGDTISVEFRAKYLAGLHRFGGSDWFRGLTVWSPNINIFRDPRWGRGQETYGEDPFLTSRMGVAFVQGLQGSGTPYYRTIATPKHYAVHSGPEPTRHEDNFDISPYDLEDTYLPAFRATIVEGKAGSIMCAYNAVNGVPACASKALLGHHLRLRWDFDGYVVSDCGAVADIYRNDQHGYADTPEEGVAAALEAGMDLICGDAVETNHILSAIEKGIVDERIVDQALVRLFAARFALGMFDDPAKVFPGITSAHADTVAHRELAMRSAEKSIVLLRNDGLLPISEAPSRIAVIGPNADTLNSLVGNYHGEPSQPVTVLAGLRKRFPVADITYAEGSGLVTPALTAIDGDALCQDRLCRKPGLKRDEFHDRAMTGRPAATEISGAATFTWNDERKSGAVRYTGYLRAPETGAYTFRYDAHGGYRIWVDEKEVVDSWQVDWRPSIATGTLRLEAGETYPIRVEAFQRQDRGDERLLWAIPSDQGAVGAVQAAADADLVVFVAGLTQSIEGEEMRVDVEGFAGGDRTSIDLPAPQQSVLEAVTATGTPVILVLINGSALAVNWADRNVSAILEAWYPGGQGGDAVARVIAGDVNPAGRLPVTVYRDVEDLPPFRDYSMTNRTYRYFRGEVLYPFGYGLSYTNFEYSEAEVSRLRVNAGEAIDLAVTVTNAGDRTGDEVVQVYLSYPGRDKAPVQSLVGFDRITLAPGESRKVEFTLDALSMSTVDEDGIRAVRPGFAKVWIGGGLPHRRSGLPAVAGAYLAFDVTGIAALP